MSSEPKVLGVDIPALRKFWADQEQARVDGQAADGDLWNASAERREELEAQARAEYAAVQDEREMARILRIRAAGEMGDVPPRVIEKVVVATGTPAREAVKAFMNGEKTLLVLGGGLGTGKSVAAGEAVCLMNRPNRVNGRDARWIKSIDLVRIGIYGEAADRFAEDCRSLRLLAIDDLGTEPRDEKGYAAANLEAALDARYDACAKTILTTNLDFDGFSSRYLTGTGERLRDRLRECGEFVGLTGPSLRRPS
ncbi:MAG: hypothetical protein IT452_04255 [Planctomycetia bacterium]|nr:hypothetical protein [Planctomycetia bacterium]